MNTIFISHSSKDDSIAAVLNRHLEMQGHRSVFLDFDPELGIPPGRNWEHELYRQLRACQAVIVLCSEHSMSSRWCFAEITHAKSLGKHLFPVKVGPCTIDPVLTSRQVLDLTRNQEDAYQRLWRGLKVAGLDPADSFDWDGSRSPYPGMMAFQEADAAVFFGREAEIQQVLETLQRLRQFGGARMLLVLGASGSGKSSLVRAGLLPRLRRNTEHWQIIDPFRPQDHPVRELSIVLAQAFSVSDQKRDWKEICEQLEQVARDENDQETAILNDVALDLQIACKQRDATTLLIIDQAEELLVRSEEERTASFLSLLRSALEAPNSPLMAIFTLRSDFLGDFQRRQGLLGLPREHLPVGPMATDHLARIIEGPAGIAGIEFEDGLTEAMVRDTESQDALPLLAFTLRELYEHYGDDKLLEVHEYRKKLGGLNGAVARAADAALAAARLSEDQEEALRNALVSLARINEAGQFTRQPARWSDLPENVHGVLERFVRARLLISRGEGKERLLEVAHEALFHSWGRLKKWLDEDREFLLWRERFRDRLHEWQRTGGDDPETLLSGSTLNEGQSWRERHGDQFTAEEYEYLDKSVLQAKKLRNRRITAFSGLILFLIAVALGGGLLWQRAEKQKAIAIEEGQKAQNLLVTNYWSNALDSKEKNDWLSLLHYAAKAGELATNQPHAKNVAYNINNHMTIFLSNILKHDGYVSGAVFNQDETRILTWSGDGTARLWDATDGASIGQPMKHDSSVSGAVFNQDETRILTWSGDGTARLWDATDGASIGQPMKHGSWVNGAVFNQDETRILTWSGIDVEDALSTARLWDATDGASIGQPMKHDSSVSGAVFNQDETRILTWSEDGTARLWDATDGASIGQPMKHDRWGRVYGAVFNQDGTRILTWSEDDTARLWDATDGASIGQPMKHGSWVNGAVFNQDGTRILTWSEDDTARLWDATDGASIGQPMKHDQRRVYGAVFNQDGTRILTWSGIDVEDALSTARLWDATDGSPIGQPMKHDSSVSGAVFNQDETRILTWSEDGTARLWDATDGASIGQPMKHDRWVSGAVFNQDETRILTWSEDGTARLWDATDGASIGQPMKHDESVNGAVFNKDETRILTWSGDGTARLWDATDGASIGQPMKHDQRRVYGAVFNQDETRILTWSEDGTARLWDATDGASIGQPMKHDQRRVYGAVFNKDETRILTWSGDGTARLWDATDGASIGQPMKHDQRRVYGAVFNQDGTRILTWSEDGTARLWDATDGASIGQPMKHDESVNGAVFNKDETRILTWSGDGTARLWDATDGASIGQPMKHDQRRVYGAVFNQDGTRILTWSEDGTARLWDATDGASIGQPMKHDESVNGAVFNKDETRILTWSEDGTARLWDATDGASIGQPMKHDRWVSGAVFNQDETRILTWSEDGTARLWDATDGASIGQPMKHGSWVNGAVFNQDETRILTWSGDRTARLWDATDGASIGQPMKHDSDVSGAVFNQDETRILTWSDDRTARLWDATDGASIGQPMKHGSWVNGAVFNQDETRILTWSGDRTARLWNIEVDEDFPKEHLSLMVKVATGTAMDDYGNVTTLSKKKWEDHRNEYIHIAEKHIKNCKHKNANIYLNYQKPSWGKK